MMDSRNFTLNRADWKMIKIPFNTTGNKCTWEQFLIGRCCHSFGSARDHETQRVFGNKNMCLIYYAAKLASNWVEILKLHQKQQPSHKFQPYKTNKQKPVKLTVFTTAHFCFLNPNTLLRGTFLSPPGWTPLVICFHSPLFYFPSHNFILLGSCE